MADMVNRGFVIEDSERRDPNAPTAWQQRQAAGRPQADPLAPAGPGGLDFPDPPDVPQYTPFQRQEFNYQAPQELSEQYLRNAQNQLSQQLGQQGARAENQAFGRLARSGTLRSPISAEVSRGIQEDLSSTYARQSAQMESDRRAALLGDRRAQERFFEAQQNAQINQKAQEFQIRAQVAKDKYNALRDQYQADWQTYTFEEQQKVQMRAEELQREAIQAEEDAAMWGGIGKVVGIGAAAALSPATGGASLAAIPSIVTS